MSNCNESYLDELDPVALLEEAKRMHRRINSPITQSFIEGVQLEVAHQVERWGVAHDRGKGALDWFWLIGFLSQKAAAAHLAGDSTKALHHTISTAAALCNWHSQILEQERAFNKGKSCDAGLSSIEIRRRETHPHTPAHSA